MSTFHGRPLDRCWFWFFVLHIPISLALDCQAIYPKSWLAGTPFEAFSKWYLAWSRDPILAGAASGKREWNWLLSYIYLEGLFQVPCFIIGAIGLYRNDKRVYPLLLAYGISTATTLIPTLSALYHDNSVPALTASENVSLLGSYVPFLIIPLGIAVDMFSRLITIVGKEGKVKTA